MIVVGQEHLADMLAEGRRTLPYETGGVLMGYATADRITVTAIVGPGPRAVHRRHSFTPDAEWQAQRVAELYERSGRLDTYLGDWHTHPNGTTRASLTDWLAASTIARSRDARCPNPVMVVVVLPAAGTPCIGAYRWQRLRLSRISCVDVP